MAIYVDRKPDWLNWLAPEEFNDNDLFRIVIFFVFHSPCPKTSAMGKSLKEYGWNTPWQKPYWLNKQLKQASTNVNLLFSSNSYDNLEIALTKASLLNDFPSALEKERICIYDGQHNQFMSVFYHIRNSLAHGRMNMIHKNGECVFVFEDVVSNSKSEQAKLSARMILKKQTLLSWIDIIEAGECVFIQNKEKINVKNSRYN